MEKTGVQRIKNGIQHLKPVTAKWSFIRHHFHLFKFHRIKNRKFRYFRDWPHIAENQPLVFNDRIGTQFDPKFQTFTKIFWLSRCVKQLTVGVEVPAVITTTDSMFLTFSVFKRSLPMRTMLVN